MIHCNALHHRLICLPLMLVCMLAGCSGGGEKSGSSGNGSGNGSGSGGGAVPATPTTDAIGIWSGTLTPDDSSEPAAAGWLVVGADGNFFLDTDTALYVGTGSTGKALSANTTGHPYRASFANAAAFTFGASVAADGTMNGSYSGGGGGGTLEFRHQSAVSQQAASLQAIAGTYHGEIWVQDSTQAATLTVRADGAIAATTASGCRLDGTIRIADAGRNGYQWSGSLAGCAVNGAASGRGFLMEQSSLYMAGTVLGAAVWMGGSTGEVPPAPAE